MGEGQFWYTGFKRQHRYYTATAHKLLYGYHLPPSWVAC